MKTTKIEKKVISFIPCESLSVYLPSLQTLETNLTFGFKRSTSSVSNKMSCNKNCTCDEGLEVNLSPSIVNKHQPVAVLPGKCLEQPNCAYDIQVHCCMRAKAFVDRFLASMVITDRCILMYRDKGPTVDGTQPTV